jgi:tripeptidyl-peptidase-1
MNTLVLLCVLAIASVCAADATAPTWQRVRFSKKQHTKQHTFRVALRIASEAALQETLMAVSTPTSPAYGEYLDNAAVRALVAPPAARVAAVKKWLRCDDDDAHKGVECADSVHGDYVFVTAPRAHVEALFDVKLVPFAFASSSAEDDASTKAPRPLVLRAHTTTTTTATTTQQQLVPASLRDVVYAVTGITDFPRMLAQSRSVRRTVADGVLFQGDNVTPPVLEKQYGFPVSSSLTKGAHAGIAVAEFEQAYFYPSDLKTFQHTYKLPSTAAHIVGPNDPYDGYLGECTLDVEYGTAAAPGFPVWMNSVSEDGFDLTAWAELVFKNNDDASSPRVQSVSWGSNESGYPLDGSYGLRKYEQAFMKLGVLGHSVLVASGDDGTGHKGTFGCGGFDPTCRWCGLQRAMYNAVLVERANANFTTNFVTVKISFTNCLNFRSLPRFYDARTQVSTLTIHMQLSLPQIRHRRRTSCPSVAPH